MTTILASENVRKQLNHARFTTASMAYIVLDEDLHDILNKECLKQVIGSYELRHMRAAKVIDMISSQMDWKKTFALLLYIGAGNLIEDFMGKDFYIAKTVEDTDLRELIPNEVTRVQFFTDQRIFLAPVFEFERFHDLPWSSNLPFLEDKTIRDQGANSTIFEITIPQSKLLLQSETLHRLKRVNRDDGKFSNKNNVRERTLVRYNLIRKELEDRQLSDHEIKIHKDLKHRCIIPLYASYRYQDKFNLLLPKGGERLKPYFQETTTWSETQYLSAIYGLSDALKAIHHLSTEYRSWAQIGCHGDLKPSNVLVDDHRFTLIDFGLTKFRQPSESSGGSNGMTGPHAAPECFLATVDSCRIESSRACDIWSFGCILAELVVFMNAPGKHVFVHYEKDRKRTQEGVTSSAFHKFGQQNEGTWVRLDAIEKESQSIAIKHLVNLIRAMLQINFSRRPNAETVTETIAGIMEGHPNPCRNLQSAPEYIEEVQAMTEVPGSNTLPSMASANQRQAALQSKKLQIGQKVDSAYAQFDRQVKESRKADLDVVLKTFLEAQAESTRLEVFDSSLHLRIQWGLMVTEKELSSYKGFDLATRMEHIKGAERSCDQASGHISQHSEATNVVHLKLEYYVIQGMKARLKFRQGADKFQTDREKEIIVDEINKALRELKGLDEARFRDVGTNIRGWRDRIAKPLI